MNDRPTHSGSVWLRFTMYAGLAGLVLTTALGAGRHRPTRRGFWTPSRLASALVKPTGPKELRGANTRLSQAAPSLEFTSAVSQTPPGEDPRVTIGRRAFFDPALSVPEGTSCASCHDPNQGYAGNHGSTVGVAQGSRAHRFARRNTPSTLYLRFVPRFHLGWEEEAEFPEAFGGFFWDGRENSLATLALGPLLNPNEMGNHDVRGVANTLKHGAYAEDLRRAFDGVFDTPEKTVEALGFCLEAFLTSRAMSPFSSKYDDYVRGTVQLSPLEAEGLALFKNPSKGACASCHRQDDQSPFPERSLFTDFGYDTVAVPRNRKLPASLEPKSFDLGVCERHDRKLHTEDEWFCGAFRTPSLRNVATRTSYMHNGVFTSLKDVVRFYTTRGTDAKRWYQGGAFDDLPPQYRQYVNVNTPPYNRGSGDEPVLTDAEMDAVVAFLGTLTDRAVPGATSPH